MHLILRDAESSTAPGPAAVLPSPAAWCEWTVILPFHNERDILPRTLESLAAQSVPLRVVLVDNGSSDGSGAVAAMLSDRLGLSWKLIAERRPGKVSALRAGLGEVRTALVATCDADTWYPPEYLAQGRALLGRRGAVAAIAWFVAPDAGSRRRLTRVLRTLAAAALLPRQCHSGGAGQVFRADRLRAVGGFDPARWNYVLEDHEIAHRLVRTGGLRYGARFWCAPSPRPRRRKSTRWTFGERALYHLTPGCWRDWFFYGYLRSRLARRGLSSERLRETPLPMERAA